MIAGRMYTVVIDGVASPAAAFDLLELNAAADKPIALVRTRISQSSEPTTEEEQIGVSAKRGATTSGSGGSAATPQPCNPGDPAASFTAEIMNTTQATGGSPVTLDVDTMNTRQGHDLPAAPEEIFKANSSTRLVLLCNAPADAVTFRATFWIWEY